ncbi:type II toxin-antitoxin system YhaV family toxin [Pseudoalteromonas sp. SG45-5]|uniref:type II toxin-antitoxin system YhaV family toxin n=1 Tax=unclassified Pseudoalteromonas TaxID=194690 RepID=UPI0015FD436E|nr:MULTISPECIES: type II toxin-antitoxin system YhaV family toxin [unclassified Pseudoalteromonas]MBB1384396.1 type II toxin-antitoxin system YhaV family toxin [Pseudoalteromonas sp. SG45-5]MBB1392316.1 type II toxin-antitoxin system YhaV family toxin [Pseudoalteromonas sp. SG44-4]MBB1446791.1 type II toxin-antitoxin system YhaV family toxin [Pseudoalteromonas sp. SG41-6]MBQ4799875.1 type II toxin-antitoxin system YhaV family toxin [Pseudoalteromonas sp. MMG006]
MYWEKYWHTVFENRYTEVLDQVEREAKKDPEHFYESAIYKLFECVTDCIENRIFIDPQAPAFILGNTLGKSNRDWRRAKKGMPNRYRLFFKFSSTNKAIVLAWFNDQSTLRKDGSKTDVYEVFKKMLLKGVIPSSIEELIEQSTEFNKQAR